MKIKVSKYHGCGNDFILTTQNEIEHVSNLEDLIIKSCDRHTGIGADGFIIAKLDPLEMIYYNSDGSRAPMCGNGIRCFAKFLYDQKIETRTVFDVDTMAGVKTVEVLSHDPFRVRVNMQKPDWDPAKIGVDSENVLWRYPLDINGQILDIYAFFMSTVHTVIFCKDAFADIEELGKAVCTHPVFKEQTNVNFVQVVDRSHIKVQTYERGSGLTLACGTGVCASALTCYLEGLTFSSMEVEMKKGSLHIEIDPFLTVYMSGPAALIIEGEYEYDNIPA